MTFVYYKIAKAKTVLGNIKQGKFCGENYSFQTNDFKIYFYSCVREKWWLELPVLSTCRCLESRFPASERHFKLPHRQFSVLGKTLLFCFHETLPLQPQNVDEEAFPTQRNTSQLQIGRHCLWSIFFLEESLSHI